MHPDLVLVANAGDATISAFRVTDDRLAHLATTPLPGACNTFALDTARGLVYAFTKGDTPTIRTLALDAATGQLTESAATNCGAPMTYLALAAEGGLLLGASYHAGVGAVWPVVGGYLGATIAEPRFRNLHCVVTDGVQAYFVSLGDDLIAQYALAADGRLTALDPPVVGCPPGCGPRHLVLSPDSANAYLVTEFSGEVLRLARDAEGRLTPAESRSIVDPDAGLVHSRYGADPRAEHLIWGADVALAGRHLLATERTAGTIASIALDDLGHLGRLASLCATEPQPRGIAVDGTGTRVLVTGELSTSVTLYAVGDDGVLTELDRVETGRGANWARFWSNPA